MSAQQPGQVPPPVDPATPSAEPAVKRSQDERNRQIAIAIIAGVAVLFALLNSQEVKVNWIVTSGKTPLILVIALAVGAGYLTAWLIGRRHKKSRDAPQ
jgi:uncharacterized integral membrane protein